MVPPGCFHCIKRVMDRIRRVMDRARVLGVKRLSLCFCIIAILLIGRERGSMGDVIALL